MKTLARRARSLFAMFLVTGLVLLGFTMIGPVSAAAQDSEVAATADVTPPVIAILPDVVAAATDASGAYVAYVLPAASDDIDGALTPSCLPVSGSLFPLGATPIVCSAWDSAGNQANVVALNIIVLDQQAPFIEQPVSIYLVANDASGMAISYAIPAAFDAISGPAPVGCAPAPGAWFPIGTTTVTCSAADASGNVAAVSFTVTLEAPAIPTEEPTEAPTEEPTEEPTTTPTESPAETPTDVPAETPDATEPPATEEPVSTETATPTESPTVIASETPTPSPSPTPVSTPAALPLPSVLPPPANPIYGSGPIDGLALIWGGLGFSVSQEYGHTEFSLSQSTLYLYGIGLGLDGRAHPGLDIGMPAGSYLYSPVNGTVVVSGGVPYYTYYGNGQPQVGELLIETDAGDHVILGHMAAIAVSAGQRVTTGQFVGLSGGENGDHLHLETRVGGFTAVDPRQSFLIPSIAAYGGFTADPGEADHASAPAEIADDQTTPESEGVAVINDPVETDASAMSQEPADTGAATGSSNLLDQLLYEPDSPYGDVKTELIGDLLGARSVTADDGSSSG